MIKPQRIRLSRRAGFSLQTASLALNGLPAVNVARPSKWGNPYKLAHYDVRGLDGQRLPIDNEHAREMAVRDFEMWLHVRPDGEALAADARRDLRGKNLACWCAASPCHADVLLEIANARKGTVG